MPKEASDMLYRTCRAQREIDAGAARERRIETLFALRAVPALIVFTLLAAQLVLDAAGA